jgi:hypothetical protein
VKEQEAELTREQKKAEERGRGIRRLPRGNNWSGTRKCTENWLRSRERLMRGIERWRRKQLGNVNWMM